MDPKDFACKPDIRVPQSVVFSQPGANVTLSCFIIGNPMPDAKWVLKVGFIFFISCIYRILTKSVVAKHISIIIFSYLIKWCSSESPDIKNLLKIRRLFICEIDMVICIWNTHELTTLFLSSVISSYYIEFTHEIEWVIGQLISPLVSVGWQHVWFCQDFYLWRFESRFVNEFNITRRSYLQNFLFM